MAEVNPYLNFPGNCEEAFNFYKSVFGGDFNSIQRFRDVPSQEEHFPVDGNLIMHISLPIGDGYYLMGSDKPAQMGEVKVGDNVHISLQAANTEETDRLFNGLSAGGQVTMPLEETFWGARFGMLVDKFGVQWMINQDIR